MKPKITGLTSMYLAALADSNHSLHSLVQMLATLDPKFNGSQFTYEPADIDLFLSQVNVQTALAISTATGIVSFTGYPFWISADDQTVTVPAYFPASTYYADDDLEQATPLQKTFAQWVTDQNHTVEEYDDNGTTKYLAGDFARHGLAFAAQVNAESGYALVSKSEAQAIYSAGEE